MIRDLIDMIEEILNSNIIIAVGGDAIPSLARWTWVPFFYKAF